LTKIGVNIRNVLGINQGNFQLHRFTMSENIGKSFRGATFFDSHCTESFRISGTAASYARLQG